MRGTSRVEKFDTSRAKVTKILREYPRERPTPTAHPSSRLPETSSRLTSLRRTFSTVAPLVPNNRSDWSQPASACLDPPKRRECLTRVAVRGGREGKSALFPLPSFLPSHLSSCPSSLLFSVSVFGGTGRQALASERARKGKERKVGRHRRSSRPRSVGQRK